MVKELDAEPVYLKRPMSLEGKAQKIFGRSAFIIADMMKYMAENEPQPLEQIGEVIRFKRRKMRIIPYLLKRHQSIYTTI